MLAPVKFPPSWTWFMDEAIPAYVKEHYSPKETWRKKPFSSEDVAFFSKGVFELSDLFTHSRDEELRHYFNHPKNRSSYFLYFLPLQAAKFVSLFQLHEKAFAAALAHGRETGTMRVLDLGAGPGTASLALLLQLLDRPVTELPPKIVLTWFDLNEKIMQEGRTLALTLASNFPKLRGRVEIELSTEPWWKASAEMARRKAGPQSLVLVGHLLNENQGRAEDRLRIWSDLLALAHGGGTLIVEPAARGASQNLSQLRDSLIQADLLKEGGLWGPCLHAGSCPLATGRDWCHFSMPVAIPGKWFREISKKLSTEKNWVKFSYLWLTAPDGKITHDASHRRVVSDRIRAKNGPETEILLCEPDQVRRAEVSYSREIFRGELYDIDRPSRGSRVVAAKKEPVWKGRRPPPRQKPKARR